MKPAALCYRFEPAVVTFRCVGQPHGRGRLAVLNHRSLAVHSQGAQPVRPSPLAQQCAKLLLCVGVIAAGLAAPAFLMCELELTYPELLQRYCNRMQLPINTKDKKAGTFVTDPMPRPVEPSRVERLVTILDEPLCSRRRSVQCS